MMEQYEPFLYGLLGGACFEFLRWRSLLLKDHGAQFKRPVFVVFSIVFVVLAGLAATAFTPIVGNVPYRPAVAFVAGAGFEKLVQLAAELKVWTPDVPMGESDHSVAASRPTFLAFVRG
ncbi:hypothetical protein [Sphingosinicella sp. BN140058]|uniref:hypothetical protein n=1 Tax=Sphingosinicella sp. BN140058 TaxID=1892855 RepID=UPI0010113EC8|nr:hypothetical protein [Sphingosinicella sp. BN140058]QAY80275.1 hypothetical protein ETR14_26895 [Sphingosinicella sp. BN140058]